MSSETSTDAFHPWQLFTLAGLVGGTVVVFVSRGQTPAGVILLSLTIFTAAIVGVAAWRTLAPFTASDERTGSRVVGVGGRTRAALEREKTLALQAIKALEFDRAMGKVSEKDFAEMGARLRARAARLIRRLDAGTGYRNEIEKEIGRRIGAGPEKQHPGYVGSEARVARFVGRACPACGKDNDLDARFCKHCGSSLELTR